MEERAQKDIAVQQALAQARAEMHEKLDGVNVVTTEDKSLSYTVSWSSQPGQGSIEAIMQEQEDSDKEKE